MQDRVLVIIAKSDKWAPVANWEPWLRVYSEFGTFWVNRVEHVCSGIEQRVLRLSLQKGPHQNVRCIARLRRLPRL